MSVELIRKTYNGNDNLLRAGSPIEWTLDMIKEWNKCKEDIIYFAEKYFYIITLDDGKKVIKLHDFQKEFIISCIKNRRTIQCTSRQIGKTTAATIVICHSVIFNESYKVGLLSNNGAAAREIMSRIQLAYEMLPDFLKVGVKEWNKGSFELENGSSCVATATSGSAARGKAFNCVYIDETAFVDGWLEFYTSVFPTLSSGKDSKIIFTSTPNGLNHFYKFCEGAKKIGTPEWNGFHYFEVPWYEVPNRDDKWKEETLAAMEYNYDQFAQEFECQFNGSSSTLISSSKLKELVFKNPIASKDGLKQYEKPEKDRVYIITVDVSRGKGLDYSVAQVIDSTSMPYKQVAVYRNNMVTPPDFSKVIYEIAKNYNDASVLVEINDIGEEVSRILYHEYEYEGVLSTQNKGRSGKQISGGFGGNVDMGIRTTKSVKSIGCSLMKLLVEQNQIILNDFDTIQELSRFSKKGNSYEAESGAHDDLVMCLVLYAWLSDQTFFRDLTDNNTIMRLRDKTEEEIMNDLLPFGFHSDGVSEVEAPVIVREPNGSIWTIGSLDSTGW